MRVKSRIGQSKTSKGITRAKANIIDGRFKDYEYPEGFVLVIDTREQKPLFEKLPKGLVITRDTLDCGDYSIKGYENVFAVERKMVSDFHSYVTSERLKTVKKVSRLRDMDFAGLVVEADEEELFWGNFHVKPKPEVVRQSICSFEVRYGIHVYVSSEREKIERKLMDWAIKFYNIKHEEVG